jgi:hypothetical protein
LDDPFISEDDSIRDLDKETYEYHRKPKSQYYIEKLTKFIQSAVRVIDPHNQQYNEFLKSVCSKATAKTPVERTSIDGVEFTCEIHYVCEDLTKEAKSTKEDWANITKKLYNNHITLHQLQIPLISTTHIGNFPEYIMKTRAKDQQVSQLYDQLNPIVLKLKHIDNQLKTLTDSKMAMSMSVNKRVKELTNEKEQLKNEKKVLKQTYSLPEHKREGYIVHLYVFTKNPKTMTFTDKDLETRVNGCDIEANTMFLWGVTETKSDINPDYRLPDTTHNETFCGKIPDLDEEPQW